MAKIPDPKEIQAQIERLVNRQVDEKIEGKPATTAPAKGAVSDPFAGMNKETPRATPPPTPPAAAAPSAPVAGGPTPEPGAAPVTGTYEVSTKGDKRFSALTARMSDGMTIEEKYMLEVKGYMVQVDEVDIDMALKLRVGDPKRYDTLVRPFKGKPNIMGKTQEQVNIEYDLLWEKWAAENPDLIDDLAKKSKGKKLIDSYARNPATPSQARSLEKILAKRGQTTAQAAPTEAPAPTQPEESYDLLMSRETPESLGYGDEAGLQENLKMIADAKARVAAQRATSIGMAPDEVSAPPMGETPASVAPTALPEAVAAPAPAPEKQVTATTPTDATVAQGKEQGTSKPLAAGSNPAGGAKKDPFSSITPEQIRAASEPSDTDFSVAPDAPEYTLPETDGRYVGIIGTAGRGEDGARITEADYKSLVDYLGKAVKANDVLISGGAAWSDHVAVRLFLDGKVGGLVLHLPAKIIAGPGGKLTFENGGFNTAGSTANYYHSLFNKALKIESDASLKQIQEAIDRGATVTYGDGTRGNEVMKERNSLVARDARDFLVAMTFDPDTERQMPKDGGTADTWRKHIKGYREAKRRLVDIRAINPDPSEGERLRLFRAKKGKYKLSQAETEQTADIFRSMAKAEGDEGSLLDKASERMTELANNDSSAQGMELQQALQAMQTEQTGQLKRALRVAFLPTDKLVSAAVLIAMIKSSTPISEEISEILGQGMLPNIAALKRSAKKEIDVEAAIRFMRDRMLFSTLEIGKGESDGLIKQILNNAGVPASAFAKIGPDAPAYTFPGADAEAAEVRIKRVDAALEVVTSRIQKTSADLGSLMSHPEVARRVYLVTSLLAGVEQDIDSEFRGQALPSRLRTDKDTGIPYLRKLEDIDPIFEYIRMRADIDPSEVMNTSSFDKDPYAIADAVISAGAKAPVSRGKRGRYTYDEAQLYATYKSGTPYRRYAFDINGEVHPLYIDLDELGLVTDKFDGFENPYAGFASVGPGVGSRENTSPAVIAMHISADSSARVVWVDRVPNKEIDVLRAIKKLLSDKNSGYVLPGTPDEIVILPGAFMRYTREADQVNAAADQASADVQAATGKIYIVDVSGGKTETPSPFVIDGVTYYTGKGIYAFKQGDDTGMKLAERVSAVSTEGFPASRFVSKPFNLGDKAEYPESLGLRKFFRIDIDPVVHMTFAHNDSGLVTPMDAFRNEDDFDEDQQITEPLKPARGGKFEGEYLLNETSLSQTGFGYEKRKVPIRVPVLNDDGTPQLAPDANGKLVPVVLTSFKTEVSQGSPAVEGVEDFLDFTDNNVTNIEFDEGLRFVVGNNIQLNRTLDGVDLIEDAYDEITASEIRQNLPISLAGAEKRAAEAESRIEQGLAPVSEDMSETDKSYRNFIEQSGGITRSGDPATDHFGRSFSFSEHEEYRSDSVFSDESVAAARLKERMTGLGPLDGGSKLDPADAARVPQFKLEDFMRPEALTPEAEALLNRLVADYFYILRVRARDVSQMVPNPMFVQQEGQVGWRRLREAVKRRSQRLDYLGYRRTLSLHRYQTREPAIFNAVLFEIFATTGDRLDVANEVAKEVYTHIEQEEVLDSKGRGTLVSTKADRYSFRDTPIVDDVDAMARIFAANVAKTMLRERKFKPYEKSAESMSLREQYLDAEADQLGTSTETRDFTRDYQKELMQIAEDSSVDQGNPTKYTGVEVGDSLEHTLDDGRKISGSTEEGKELIAAIIKQQRDNDQLDAKFASIIKEIDSTGDNPKLELQSEKILEYRRAGQKRLNNFVNALEALEEEAAIKSLRKRTAPKSKPAEVFNPDPDASALAVKDFDSDSKRILGGLTQDELRAFASRSWALYSDHLANDGDRDGFVKMINGALRKSSTVKGKQNKLNQIMNFVFDNNGTVVVPDAFFTDEKGNKSYPEPKIKNPQYSSASRRANAFDGTFAIDEMEKFLKSVLGKSKTASALGEIIRYAKMANNFEKDKKRQLRFYVTTDPRTGLRKFFLSVSPTYPSQKRVVTPYAPGGLEADEFNNPFAVMGTAKERLQSMSAQDMESLLAGNGVDSAIRVVRKESAILSQAEGVAQVDDFSKAQPYDLVFNSEFDVDEISGAMLGEMPDHVRGDDRAKVLKTVLDASVRARFFQIMKASMEANGLDSSFITEDDIDSSAFKSVDTPEGTRYELKPRIEQDGTFAGPFSRSGKGPVRTLKLRDIDGNERISRVMNMLLEQIKGGDSYAEQSDMDEAASQVRRVIDFQDASLKAKAKPRFSPGAKAGIAGGALAGTIAAYLQFGADEQAGDIALQSLPSQVAFEALGAIPKVGGPVAAATGLGLTYATGGDMLRALAGITGSVVGGIAGTGAGLFTGPGAFVSGLAGSTAGYMLADSLYSSVSGKSSPMPSNVARSNPVVDQKMDNPSVRTVTPEAPMPVVNRDLAKLEEMGG